MNSPFLKSLRPFGLASLLYLLLLGFASASLATEAPEAVIQNISDKLADVWAREQERIKTDPTYVHRLADEIVLPHVDFQEVSRLAVGKHWRQANPAQQQEFAEQFKTLLIRTYASAFHELGTWSIQFLPGVAATTCWCAPRYTAAARHPSRSITACTCKTAAGRPMTWSSKGSVWSPTTATASPVRSARAASRA